MYRATKVAKSRLYGKTQPSSTLPAPRQSSSAPASASASGSGSGSGVYRSPHTWPVLNNTGGPDSNPTTTEVEDENFSRLREPERRTDRKRIPVQGPLFKDFYYEGGEGPLYWRAAQREQERREREEKEVREREEKEGREGGEKGGKVRHENA